jgi:hypothetical protein
MKCFNTGKIRNAEYLKQAIDPTGMTWGNISGCDIDYFYDFNDKVFIFIELKYKDAEMKTGQRLALERLCDACQRSGRETILLLARHDSHLSEEIPLEHTSVDKYRYKYDWHNGNGKHVREAMDIFLEFADRKFSL